MIPCKSLNNILMHQSNKKGEALWLPLFRINFFALVFLALVFLVSNFLFPYFATANDFLVFHFFGCDYI